MYVIGYVFIHVQLCVLPFFLSNKRIITRICPCSFLIIIPSQQPCQLCDTFYFFTLWDRFDMYTRNIINVSSLYIGFSISPFLASMKMLALIDIPFPHSHHPCSLFATLGCTSNGFDTCKFFDILCIICSFAFTSRWRHRLHTVFLYYVYYYVCHWSLYKGFKKYILGLCLF